MDDLKISLIDTDAEEKKNTSRGASNEFFYTKQQKNGGEKIWAS